MFSQITILLNRTKKLKQKFICKISSLIPIKASTEWLNPEKLRIFCVQFTYRKLKMIIHDLLKNFRAEAPIDLGKFW